MSHDKLYIYDVNLGSRYGNLMINYNYITKDIRRTNHHACTREKIKRFLKNREVLTESSHCYIKSNLMTVSIDELHY